MLNKIHMFLNRYGVSGKYLDKPKVSKNHGYSRQEQLEDLFDGPFPFRQAAEEFCEKALIDAKTQLHPLLQQADLERLDQRREFVEAFKHALERVIAERIVLWLPNVKKVYTFDPPRGRSTECWDNTIHLLILVPQLLPSINELGAMLDYEMLERLKRFYWSRFQDSKSVIEIQQVTPYEIRHGVCYGAMFYSFYTAPSQVWPVR
jgi:hypothetical protein